jgi:hypothetical protein
MRRLLASLVLAVALLGSSGAARGETFTVAETARLARGETVARPQKLVLRGGHYVGGVTYTILDATPADLDALLGDVSSYRHILPYTKDARLVGGNRSDSLIWLRQGTGFLDASYTIRVHAGPGDHAAERAIRFSLDPSRAHGIHDAWGFVLYEPTTPSPSGQPRVLVTFGIWVDVGPGIVRALFEGRIQQIVLTVPQRLRDYLTERIRSAGSGRAG